MEKIEATGNTKTQAMNNLNLERQYIVAQTNAEFGEIRVYGNSEMGFKVVQDYKPGI